MFLLKDILPNTYCRFINIELMANSTITHALKQLPYKAYLRHIFPLLHKAHDSLSELTSARQHCSPILWGHVKQQNKAPHRWGQGPLASAWEPTRRQSPLVRPQLGLAGTPCTLAGSNSLLLRYLWMSEDEHETALSTDKITNKF